MATVMVKVCDGCGKQSANIDGWITVSSLDISAAATGETLARPDRELDMCSMGCLLRYITKRVDSGCLRTHCAGNADASGRERARVA